MFYLFLLAGVMLFMTVVAALDASLRQRSAAAPLPSGAKVSDPKGVAIAEIAQAMAQRFGGHGALLRVPARALDGAPQESRPCRTPIDCVADKRCAGHCTGY